MATKKIASKITTAGLSSKELTKILDDAREQARQEVMTERSKEIQIEHVKKPEPEPDSSRTEASQKGGGFFNKIKAGSKGKDDDLGHIVQMQRLTIATLEKTIDQLMVIIGEKDRMFELQSASSEAVVEACRTVEELLNALDTAKNVQLSQAQLFMEQQARDIDQLRQTNEALSSRVQLLTGGK